MRMNIYRKIVSAGLVGVLASTLVVMPVLAHGHHGSSGGVDAAKDAVCEVCPVDGCTKTGLHVHDKETYCGYAHEGGYCDGSCGAVGVCTVDGCTKTGLHVHNKETYCGYAHECGYCDGSCGAVEVCQVDGCTKTGLHTHNKETYCGYAHGNGYCDGSCKNTGASSGHHSGKHHR